MRVEVKDLVTKEGGEHHIVVKTAAASATLPLRTSANQIVPGASFTAELDIEVPLVAGKNARPTAERAYHIGSDSECVTLVGVIEGIDPDGLVDFRLGSDSLVMIEAEPDQFVTDEWLRIIVPLSQTGISLG